MFNLNEQREKSVPLPLVSNVWTFIAGFVTNLKHYCVNTAEINT